MGAGDGPGDESRRVSRKWHTPDAHIGGEGQRGIRCRIFPEPNPCITEQGKGIFDPGDLAKRIREKQNKFCN